MASYKQPKSSISAITQKYEQEERGFPPYNPRMMVALLFYAYCRGIFSSRKIMQACDVTDETNDKRQFEPMLEKAQENVGKDKRIKAASADTGYNSV